MAFDVCPLSDSRRVRVAVVVPTYRQPTLLAEALVSALGQRTDFPFAIVVVNDGCPQEETDWLCREFAVAHRGRLFFVRQRNRGLSAARNTGINFALMAFPALEAVYFLDSDNRLFPYLLQRLHDGLSTAPAEIGWTYTDIDKFGFEEFCDLSGNYSPLEHLYRNISEAGSMVARRMLDAGVRFDETMRDGYEDWEFWLQGLEKGFHGRHVALAGFRYRQRGDSMLQAASQRHNEILRFIHAKHPSLFRPPQVLRREAAHNRRYALIFVDGSGVEGFTDPLGPAVTYSTKQLMHHLCWALERPNVAECPECLVVLPPSIAELLRRHRLLSGIIWTLHLAAVRAEIVTCRLELENTAAPSIEWRPRASADLSRIADSEIIAVRTQQLIAMDCREPADLPAENRTAQTWRQGIDLVVRLGIPKGEAATPRAALNALMQLRRKIEAMRRRQVAAGWASAQLDRHRAPLSQSSRLYHALYHLPSLFPAIGDKDRRTVALVAPGSATSRDLTVAITAVERWHASGWERHLIVLGGGPLAWTEQHVAAFATVNLIPLSLLRPARSAAVEPPPTQAYLGALVPRMPEDDLEGAIATLAAFNRAVFFGGPELYPLAGILRRLGVECWAVFGGQPGSATGEPLQRRRVDDITAWLGFENAYDLIIVLDDETEALCRSLGTPVAKILSLAREGCSDGSFA